MKKVSTILVVAALLFCLSAVFAVAKENPDKPEKTDGFVCPVLGGQAGEQHGNSNPSKIVPIGPDDYTVPGPVVKVPVHATNDDGSGTPPGPHASPGDTSYTAIWANQNQ